MENNCADNDNRNEVNPLKRFSDILAEFQDQHRLRSIPDDRSDRDSIDLTSNDYLSIAQDRKLAEEFLGTNQQASFSSSASRLLSRKQNAHLELERKLAELYGKEILLFNSGYHANVGIIQALTIPGTIFLCDKLIHASMIDGLTLAKAEYRRWRHNDLASLETLLHKNRDKERCIVVVESIYSMDGDLAPLTELVALKKRYPNMILYVDEAHAVGVRGDKGLGVAEESGLLNEVDILVGTFGKALASSGAFVATSPLLKNYFINCSRSFIFSTALPPINSAWTLHIINKMVGMQEDRNHLDRISEKFRTSIEEITGEPCVSQSQIVPLIIGDAEKAVKLSKRLADRNIDSLPIRRPTVPAGSERIRFSLSASLSEEQIDYILNAIKTELNEI